MPLFLLVGIIFLASSSQGSASEISRFIRPLLELLFPDSPESVITTYHLYIRKSAHFIEYAILAFLASRAFWGSGKEFLWKFWNFAALLVVVIVSFADEFNQSFNQARTGSFYDVLIDISGGFLAF